ncbi:hypothetical protein B4N84_00760, partial [Flavobacterium sp. IR1]
MGFKGSGYFHFQRNRLEHRWLISIKGVHMKKIMMCVVMLVLGFVLILGTANETKAASTVVKMDGAEVVNGRTLVPLRSVFEELGAIVMWNQQQKTVTITHGAKTIMLKIDSTRVNVNGQP